MRTKHVIRACVLVLVAGSAACTAPALKVQPPTSTAPASSNSSTSANGYSYGYGYGTYYAATRRSELGRPIGGNWGNAKTWYAHAQAAGFSVGSTPQKGAIAWTDHGPYGQVAIVEDVNADGTQVVISEMNGKDGWNKVTTRTAPANSFQYIY